MNSAICFQLDKSPAKQIKMEYKILILEQGNSIRMILFGRDNIQ